MAYWRSEWGQTEKEAYKAGIRKGRRLEREELGLAYPNPLEEEIPFMCDPNVKKSKIDQLIYSGVQNNRMLERINEQLNVLNSTLSRIEDRQDAAAKRNTTIPHEFTVKKVFDRYDRIEHLVKELSKEFK